MTHYPARVSIGCLAIVCMALFGIASADLQTIIDLPANTWYAVPNTRLDASPEAAPNYLSSSDFEKIRRGWFGAIMDGWSGGAYDTKRDRLVIWGGGDNDYWGNEIYAFDVASLAWHRQTDPSLEVGNCQQVNPDGTPNGRHTYGGLAYINHADRFFAAGGAWNCTNRGCGIRYTWTFDFVSKQWNNQNPSGTLPAPYCGYSSAYDPVGKKVYLGVPNSDGGFYSYDYDANRWTKLTNDDLYEYTMAVDTRRGLLVAVGQGSVYVYNIRANPVTHESWSSPFSGKVGMDYDPVADRMVAWSGGAVYALNLDTKTWTTHNASGAPTPNSNGTYGRWRYSPIVNAFISVNAVGQNVYFYKFTAGGGTDVQRNTLPAPSGRNFNLLVSPNPISRTAFMSLKAAAGPALRIHDLRGRPVADASRLSVGVYLVESVSGKHRTTQKIAVIQ